MGVTGAIFNGLTFDGESSKDYGVYITGQAVYNSPERDVEMISIPGRDGAFALDRGRFSNITVTYPAGLFGVDHAGFAQAISDFRNMLGSRVGYCRLEDDYNPGEYREAVFKAGVEVTPASLESGQFDIVFECKPQRWLTSGEDAVAVTSGDTITNPTLFDAKPLLQVWGYGEISMGGQGINIGNVPLGDVLLLSAQQNYNTSASVSFSQDVLESGDTITLTAGTSCTLSIIPLEAEIYANNATASVISDPDGIVASVTANGFLLLINLNRIQVNNGTTWTSGECIIETTITGTASGTPFTSTFRVKYKIIYGSSGAFSIIPSWQTPPSLTFQHLYDWGYKYTSIYGYSTKTVAPMYIDLDIGEVYILDGAGVPVSVNNTATIPAVLPTLPPGATTITYDNTITQFKVVPRWWQL